jgi:hypothetical protein
MKKLYFKTALVVILGLYFNPSDSFAQCACIEVDPPVQGYKYWCCDNSNIAPQNSGNGYLCPDATNYMASGQSNKGQCCVANPGDSC